MDLALSISLKPEGVAPEDLENVAELDGEEVLGAVVHALSSLGTVRVWDTVSLTAAEIASQRKPDIIFNLAEGVRGAGREAQVPALFEWLQWPYVGSDPVTLAIALDKWYTKCVLLAAGIPTPRARLAQHPLLGRFSDLKFPLIVKPVVEGSAKGIYYSSVVGSEEALLLEVEAKLERYRQPALIEEFLPGREFTVALIGNIGRWEVLPIVEINLEAFGARPYPIYGYEAKWASPSTDDLSCPARISDGLQRSLEEAAIGTCEALRIRDWARVDIRLDGDGTPNVLEVNPLPGILPGNGDISGFTRAAYAAGLDYDTMIHRLVYTALERYGLRGSIPDASTRVSTQRDANDAMG